MTFQYPYDVSLIQRKRKSLKRELLANLESQQSAPILKIAILGGSTTSEFVQISELFFLNAGFLPIYYESSFNRYYEEIMFDTGGLRDFAPDIVYIYTTQRNIEKFPAYSDDEEKVKSLLDKEYNKYLSLWEKLRLNFKCTIIQNNFEYPDCRPIGNLEAVDYRGKIRFINRLNEKLHEFSNDTGAVLINDINYQAASFGLERWHERSVWHSYKFAYSLDAVPCVADSFLQIVRSVKGKSKKCLVLDLDNTLWGGVIGDEGIDGILIGQGEPIGEAFQEFQNYISQLKDRGVILAVCSKNNPQAAVEGFAHPGNILRPEDFASFKCNWDPKDDGLKAIASEINIGLDSLVFFDDNPVERQLIRSQLPQVMVPEPGEDITKYLNALDRSGFYETTKLLAEDTKKAQFYQQNRERESSQKEYESYEDFLLSLGMKAEIKSFSHENIDRIAQLINKTNQFNLTTKRLDKTELMSFLTDQNLICLYAKLEDKFGDNGIVSALIAIKQGAQLIIDSWVMSCRVFNRHLEFAMFDALVSAAASKSVSSIRGIYLKSEKNNIVSDLYPRLGLKSTQPNEWEITDLNSYNPLNKVIEVLI